ncbi:DUF4254 domain-containing protein [Nocardia cyriacigeorgica]|uniref:DUF4254 domain-containing protein n=1 Tax=Nocardia cyriacigeorgica TaxID=135487 RepID=UPI00189629CE|nr:DUF4254 domain-containing protein [Nocardia cyriacigeorgica]MBF6397900.1 DUF4254 domain-containing protein [Nocardia cyriacigeorgica]MBF6402443.1 DUF4254 domain-containing protein [Nocardia cyriacigeorgica]
MIKQLPTAAQLLTACRGFPDDANGPLVDAAVELGRLHSDRLATPAEGVERIDWRRAQLVLEIDRFVLLAVPVPYPGARIHTETVGRVIDRLAELTAHTYCALAAPSNSTYIDVCARLDELASAYQDLIDDLAAGTRRLPDHGH